MKLKLILVTVLAFGSLAHAQGFVSNLSVGLGLQGIFPASTFVRAESQNGTASSTQATTDSMGALADVRYDFGRHSAIDAAVTINRNSELYLGPSTSATSSGFLQRAQTNNVEIIGTYIVRLPSTEKLKPYALVGGGMVHFSPNNDFNTVGTPSSQFKPAFAYGFGTDIKLSDSWGVRLQYRGLVRGEPDFNLLSAGFGTGLKTHVVEPSIQVMYHF